MSEHQAFNNTDREIWRGPDEGNGSAYADSIHVTQQGGIGINVNGMVFVKPVREWHKLAARDWPPQVEGSSHPAPAAPDGWILVPRELTAENGAKAALIGEFSEEITTLDEDGDEQCVTVPVSWDTIKSIHRIMVRLFDTQRVLSQAAPPARSTASSAEPVARVPKVRTSHHRNKEEAARLQLLVDKKYTTPPSVGNADAVREVSSELEAYLHNLPQGRLLIGGEFKDVVKPEYMLVSDRDAILAALSSAPVAGVDIIEQCAQAAEGPIYKEKYRGREGHNWWHEKQPGSDSSYGNGRHDAAADIRALSRNDRGSEAQ